MMCGSASSVVVSSMRRSLETLGAMALLGPPVLVALWPWLWHEPVDRFLYPGFFSIDEKRLPDVIRGLAYLIHAGEDSFAFRLTLRVEFLFHAQPLERTERSYP